MSNRRDFLKLVAGSLGGAILSSCGSGGGGAGPSGPGAVPGLPNAYRFYRLKSSGETVAGSPIDHFYGSTHLCENGRLSFNSRDASDRGGLYELMVDFAGERPTVAGERVAIEVGQTLADGRLVHRVNAVDTNRDGDLAVTVLAGNPGDNPAHFLEGLYLERGGGGFQPVLLAGQSLGNGIKATGMFGDIDLHSGGDLLIVANHVPEDAGFRPGQGLFYVPASTPSSSSLLMSTGDPVPAADALVAGIGLIDLHDHGIYVAQASANRVYDATTRRARAGGGEPETVLLRGNVAAPADARPVASSRGISAGALSGDTLYGPRVGPDGLVAHILSGPGDVESLIYGSQVVLTTGDPSPAGGEVLGFGPGAISETGVLYYTLFSRSHSGLDLVAFNGREHRVILSRGDTLADGGAAVEAIIFGTSTEHLDSTGRLTLLCEFADRSSSVVVGLPV